MADNEQIDLDDIRGRPSAWRDLDHLLAERPAAEREQIRREIGNELAEDVAELIEVVRELRVKATVQR